MKIVIDIPEDMYNDADILIVKDFPELKKAIVNGTPYEENPHGEWIEESSETGALGIKYTWVRCNRCGWDNSLVIPKNFCPNCGACMIKDV